MLGSEPTNRNNVPYHITNYPIFGVAFGLIYRRARYSHGLQTNTLQLMTIPMAVSIDFLPIASGLRVVYHHQPFYTYGNVTDGVYRLFR
jgi:hypothetical protein